jgi:FkbM family methyltransferase
MPSVLSKAARLFDPKTMERKVRGALPYLRYKLHQKSPEAVGENALRVQTWWGSVVTHKNSSSITESLIKSGVYDLDMSLAILDAVQPGMTVVNIGANVGIFSLLAAKRAGSTGKVFAFEPDPRSFGLLTLNAAATPSVIDPQPYAVGDKEEEISLWLDDTEPGDSSQSSENTQNAHEHRVRMIRLDDFLHDRGREADVIIMDIQGAEPFAFEGMRETLKKDQSMTIFFECSPKYTENMGGSIHTIHSLLKECGFTLSHIRKSNLPDPDTEWNELIDECLRRKNGYGFCNLVAKK